MPPTPSARSADTAKDATRKTGAAAKRTARQARKVPGVAQAEGQIKGVVATADDLAIARYDALTAEEIIGRLPSLSQIDLAKIDSYERRHESRTTILSRITSLRGNEPWPGYDELTGAEVQAFLSEAQDDELTQRGPLLRARAQEPRRRAERHRARAQPRLSPPPDMLRGAAQRASEQGCE